MTKAITQTYTTVHDHRVFIIRALFAGCILSAAWYFINVYATISNTIAAEHVSAQADALGNSIGQLDAQYLGLADSASPAALSAHGMISGVVTAYIPLGASLGSVALSGHEL
jgi:hypothetical protein